MSKDLGISNRYKWEEAVLDDLAEELRLGIQHKTGFPYKE